MKKILALLAAALSLGVVAPSTAQAGHGSSRMSQRCGSCGEGVYQVRYVCGYDGDGCPIYRWRTVRHHCRPRHDHGHGGHGGHDSHRGHGGHDSHRGHDSYRGHGW